jgi:hypothetical protein
VTTLTLAKSMTRPLSAEEKQQLLAWWEANQDAPIEEVIEKFEAVFDTPITKHAVMCAMMERI